MSDETTVNALEALLAGCDPSTGEILDDEFIAILKQEAVQNALELAVDALQESAGKKARPPLRPLTRGHPLHNRIFQGDRPILIAQEIQSEPGFEKYIVFVQNGYFFEIYDEDAHTCADIFGWKIAAHGPEFEFTGTPLNSFRFKNRLESEGRSYIIVGQIEYPSSQPIVERCVIELYDADT